MKIFSFDAETDGLWGKSFAIAASVSEGGKEIATFYGQLPVSTVRNPWVVENVVPQLGEATHQTYAELLGDFAAFYMQHKKDAHIVAAVAFPVESGLLRELHSLNLIGDWDAPFPLLDTAPMLLLAGENPVSEQEYAAKWGIELPEGGTHNPLFDCRLTAKVFQHLSTNKTHN